MRRLMALALLLPAPALAQAAPQSLSVELASFSFTPATLTLHRGESYHLRLVNVSSGGHDFAAPEFFAASTIAPADSGKVKNGKVDLGKGETVEVTVTPNRAGTYKIHCTHFMHSSFGMTGSIVVQ